ncbi:hypothetical protein ACIQAC_10145 [Streptomyces sp. NPDC088387]|uniref:hypothetical protein n=1 Tax=Streptomyces sp. NPDC088387 TaxID=3365859 RepID=UPI003815C5B1
MSDELSAALRELAATEATRTAVPPAGGAGVRGRAVRRRRRRRTALTLGAGTAGLALVALTLHFGASPEPPDRYATPAASPAASPADSPADSPTDSPAVTAPVSPAPPSEATSVGVSGTLDLSSRTFAFAGRVLPLVGESGIGADVGAAGPMTVSTKEMKRDLTVDVLGKGRTSVTVPYAVELRDRGGLPLYVATFEPVQALSDYAVVDAGLIVLGAEDARWFFDSVGLGENITVTTSRSVRTPAG